AAELRWCRPFPETLEDNTDLEDDTSDFEDGPDLFTADRIYAKKTNQAGQEYYLVCWVGYQELTWQPASDLPQNMIATFNNGELGVAWPVDYRDSVPTGITAGARVHGRARRS
ncbi:hypothetical protein JG688_00010209, partial [Phytophthora aleatoria]